MRTTKAKTAFCVPLARLETSDCLTTAGSIRLNIARIVAREWTGETMLTKRQLYILEGMELIEKMFNETVEPAEELCKAEILGLISLYKFLYKTKEEIRNDR